MPSYHIRSLITSTLPFIPQIYTTLSPLKANFLKSFQLHHFKTSSLHFPLSHLKVLNCILRYSTHRPRHISLFPFSQVPTLSWTPSIHVLLFHSQRDISNAHLCLPLPLPFSSTPNCVIPSHTSHSVLLMHFTTP